MPNWCHNTLVVEGGERELKRFQRRVASPQDAEDVGVGPLFFSSLVPEPKDVDDWYSWRVENWGTKWEPSFSGTGFALGAKGANPNDSKRGLFEDDGITYKFETAWAPPSTWVEKASRMFPSLRFTIVYAEAGCDFAGEEVYIAGSLHSAESKEVNEVLSSSEMWF